MHLSVDSSQFKILSDLLANDKIQWVLIDSCCVHGSEYSLMITAEVEGLLTINFAQDLFQKSIPCRKVRISLWNELAKFLLTLNEYDFTAEMLPEDLNDQQRRYYNMRLKEMEILKKIAGLSLLYFSLC